MSKTTQAENQRLPHSESDEILLSLLQKTGLITHEQVQDIQRSAQENSQDVRQAILDLNLIPSERLNALALDLLVAQAPSKGIPSTLPESVLPTASHDSAKHQRDIRKELRELAVSASLPDLVGQVLERALESRATDIHFDPQENGLRVRFRIDGM